ncbi:hypothetical protein ACJJIW_16895 [Microbulbifer sp. JMSA004]|uniref:hypothetical protein n=1 Tax=Microbulbifer sp. JMSA004 TaxID=3243370 RepID=UPI00403A74AC
MARMMVVMHNGGELTVTILIISVSVGLAKYFDVDVYAFLGAMIVSVVSVFYRRENILRRRISILERKLEAGYRIPNKKDSHRFGFDRFENKKENSWTPKD